MTRARTGASALLRVMAIAIAIGGAADPVISMNQTPPRRWTVSIMAPTEHDAALASVAALKRALRFSSDAAVRDADTRLTCDANEVCVIVADGSTLVPLPVDRKGPTAVIHVTDPASPNMALTDAAVSARQDPRAAGRIQLRLNGLGVSGAQTLVTVFDGAIPVGSTTHQWTGDGDVSLALDWWPIADGPRILRVEAAPVPTERARADNQIEVAVDVEARAVPVLVYDARPSWASVFVRRALESDARFTVQHRARLGPNLSSGTATARLDRGALDEPSVVVIGGPEALRADEVELIDRYVRVRGGSLLLLPDRGLNDAASRWIGSGWKEHLSPSASAVGGLVASELLRIERVGPLEQILGVSDNVPTIVLSPSGQGRVVVSGAMDSWRYRDAGDANFEDFWRSLVGRLAQSSAALTLELPESLAPSTTDVPVIVRHRAFDTTSEVVVRAEAHCEAGVSPIRLWPTGEVGVFEGQLHAPLAGRCRITASTGDGRSASAALGVSRGPGLGATRAIAALTHLANESSGLMVKSGEESKVAQFLESLPSSPPAPTPVHPMRSAWWMLPFAFCLGGEWWVRRRQGLR